MTELKTLENIRFQCEECTLVASVQMLKQEAIKWYNRSDDDKHAFIKKFFNITDKEIIDAKCENHVGDEK